jgi:hypothetical protein
MSSFLIYAVGLVIVLAGLIYGATLLHIPHSWIIVGALVVLGGGIAIGVGKTRQKDVPEQE